MNRKEQSRLEQSTMVGNRKTERGRRTESSHTSRTMNL